MSKKTSAAEGHDDVFMDVCGTKHVFKGGLESGSFRERDELDRCHHHHKKYCSRTCTKGQVAKCTEKASAGGNVTSARCSKPGAITLPTDAIPPLHVF